MARWGRGAVTAVAAAMIGLAASGTAAATGWRPPLQLPGVQIATGDGLHVGIDAAGDALAMWNSVGSAPPYPWPIQVAERPAGAASWGAPQTLGTPASAAAVSGPRVNARGDVLAAWSEIPTAGAALRIVVAQRAAGGAWQIVPISPSPTPAGHVLENASVGLDDAGDAVVAWDDFQSSGSPTHQLVVATRSGATGVWTVTPLDAWAAAPQVAMDAAGDAVLVYLLQQTQSPNNFVVWSRYRPAGQTVFGPPVQLSNPNENTDISPRVAIGARGDVVASWTNPAGGHLRTRSAATGQWQAVQLLSASGGLAGVAVGDDGSAVAAWGPTGAGPRPLMGATMAPDGAWSASAQWWIGPGKGVGVIPMVAIDHGGTATVVFGGDDGAGSFAAAFALRRAPGGALGPATAIGPTGDAIGSPPSIALDARGDVLVGWESSSDSAATMAAYVAGPPSLSGLSVPGSAVAGTAVPLSVAASSPFAAPVAVHWSFGDGGSADGASASHAWAAAGTYTVMATATDASGASASASGTVTVGVASGGGPGPGGGGVRDRTPPTLTLAAPACPKRLKGSRCRAYRASVKAWRSIGGTVRDASGVKSVTVTLTSGSGRACRFLAAGRRLRSGRCSAARPVAAKVDSRRHRWSLALPALSRRRWSLTVRATDRAGNVATLRRKPTLR